MRIRVIPFCVVRLMSNASLKVAIRLNCGSNLSKTAVFSIRLKFAAAHFKSGNFFNIIYLGDVYV
mgnify:CR=1 FL=1